MTTRRFVVERILLECEGASVAITSVGDEPSECPRLCIELVTPDPGKADQSDDDARLAPYCPELFQTPPPSRVAHGTGPRRRRRALLAVAVGTIALLAVVAETRGHGTPASTSTTVALEPVATSHTNTDPANGRALVTASADLAHRCTQMIDAASAALGTNDASFVRTLVTAYQGETLNDAVRQELTDGRANLVDRLSHGDETSQQALAGLDALDVAMSDVDSTPCSGPDEGRAPSPAPLPVRTN